MLVYTPAWKGHVICSNLFQSICEENLFSKKSPLNPFGKMLPPPGVLSIKLKLHSPLLAVTTATVVAVVVLNRTVYDKRMLGAKLGRREWNVRMEVRGWVVVGLVGEVVEVGEGDGVRRDGDEDGD